MNINSTELIEDVLKLRKAADRGMRDRDNLTDSKIAEIINITHGTTHHTKHSVRAIWRRHKDKRDTPSFDLSRITPWKTKEPLSLEGNTLIIGDTHLPFVHPGYFDFLYRTYTIYDVQNVLHVGDLTDQYALSFFDKEPESDNIYREFEKAKKAKEELVDMFPHVKLVEGNHDHRYLKVAMKAGIPQIMLRSLEEVLELPDTWVFNKSYIINDDILFEHGTSAGANATVDRAWSTSMNVIQGHTHNYAGVQYRNCGFKQRWALNVGCGIDIDSYAAKYGLGRKYQPTLSCGILLNGVPISVPFEY